MSANYDLCESLRAIAGVIGRNRALALAGKVIRWNAAKGRDIGRRGWVYVPHTRTENCVLSGLVEPGELAALIAALGGELLQVTAPMAIVRSHRDTRILELKQEGLSHSLIAELMGLSSRQVQNIVRRELA